MIYNFFNSYIYEFYFFPFFLDYFLGNEPFINLIMFSEFLLAWKIMISWFPHLTPPP